MSAAVRGAAWRTNHHEIAVRYAWNARQQRFSRGSPKLIVRLRLREIERLYADRYGERLPDDDAGLDDLELAAHHIAHLDGDAERHILDWARVWAPWLWYRRDIDPIEFSRRIAANPKRFKADTLAWRLRLTKEQRSRLSITTIGAVDCNKHQRAELRQRKKLLRDATRRHKAGSKPRCESDAQKQPWVAMGMSRATWYRRGKPMPDRPAAHHPLRQIRAQQTEVTTMVGAKSSQSVSSFYCEVSDRWNEFAETASFIRYRPIDWTGGISISRKYGHALAWRASGVRGESPPAFLLKGDGLKRRAAL